MNAWDARFLEMAALVGSWSKDPSTRVGAVIVRPDKTVASVGFNGFPRGVADDGRLLDRPTKYAMILHAEVNAILSAREPVAGFDLYVTPLHPCSNCASVIIQSGIRRVFTTTSGSERWRTSFDIASQMFSEAMVEVVTY